MKKYISLFIITILVISLCACGKKESTTSLETSASSSVESSTSESANPTESASVQTTEGQDKKITIEVSMPDGWQPVEGSVLPVQYMKNTDSFMVKEELFSGSTLDAVVEEALEIYGNTFDNLNVQGEVEPITIDNKEAKKLTFTCVVSKMNMKYTYVYLFVEGKIYVITFGGLEDSFDSLSSDYEAILNNIKFIVQ